MSKPSHSAPSRETPPDEITTVIRNVSAIAYDGIDHRWLDAGEIAFRENKIVYVGPGYTGKVDRVVEGRGRIAIPGLISTHAHVGADEMGRFILDGGRRDFFRSGFLNYVPTKVCDPVSLSDGRDSEVSYRYGMASLIRHGVTSVVVVEGGGGDNGATMASVAGELGLRLFYAPAVGGVAYSFDAEGRLIVRADKDAADRGIDDALAYIETHHDSHDGRVRAVATLDEFYGAEPRTLHRLKEISDEYNIPLTMHFCEQLPEFIECVRNNGITPVEFLEREGLLSSNLILAHCVYISGHSATNYPYDIDIDLLSGSGAKVAHSALALARRGLGLESFERYWQAGIAMSIGTDVFPLDPFMEMRMASLACKLIDRKPEAGDSGKIFRAATLAGASAVGCDDLGRIGVGAKADIVLIESNGFDMGVIADPVRMLVHSTSAESVTMVICDGRTLLDEGRLTFADQEVIVDRARTNSADVWKRFPSYHWAGKTLDEEFPPTLERWRESGNKIEARN